MDYDINRDNFDTFWLEPDDSDKGYTKFEHRPLKEKQGVRESIRPALIEAILDYHFHPERIRGTLERLGFPKAAEFLVAHLPRDEKTRKGNFGEVVASEHLRQRYGYKMPVFKLRFMDNPNMPMRGEDIIAFKMSEENKITTICIGEAKTSERYNRHQVEKGYDRLVIAYHPHPISLSLICNILHERDNHDLAEQIDMILENMGLRIFPCHNWLFIITGNRPRDPFSPVEEKEGVISSLKTVDIYLPRLSSFINDIFENLVIRN